MVSPADLRAIVAAVVRKAKAGNIAAARLLIDRLYGPPTQIDPDADRPVIFTLNIPQPVPPLDAYTASTD